MSERRTLGHGEKLKIMQAANDRGLTYGGVPVMVSGVGGDWAKLVVADRDNPLHGFSCEASWLTVKDVTNGSGKFAS